MPGSLGERKEREDRVIGQFCERLEQIERINVRILDRPEKSGKGGCDAIIGRGDQRNALEHKTVDTFPDQRSDNDRFRRVIVPVENAIKEALPDSAVEISVPIGAVQTGENWEQLTRSLIGRFADTVKQLRFGQRFEGNLPDVPFPVRITRHRKTGAPMCMVMRFAPEDTVAEIVQVLPNVIHQANLQLVSYKRDGYRTVLLLDTDDFVLITRPQVAEAFASIAPHVSLEYIDEVFVAETYRDPIWIYPVRNNGGTYPSLADYERFLREQYRLTYGEDE